MGRSLHALTVRHSLGELTVTFLIMVSRVIPKSRSSPLAPILLLLHRAKGGFAVRDTALSSLGLGCTHPLSPQECCWVAQFPVVPWLQGQSWECAFLSLAGPVAVESAHTHTVRQASILPSTPRGSHCKLVVKMAAQDRQSNTGIWTACRATAMITNHTTLYSCPCRRLIALQGTL